jgi:hypothetical protein
MAHKDTTYPVAGQWASDIQVAALKTLSLDASQLSPTPVDGMPDAVVHGVMFAPVAYGAMTAAGETVYVVGYKAGNDLDIQVFRPDGTEIESGVFTNGQGTVRWS